jgi:hypothetical protein
MVADLVGRILGDFVERAARLAANWSSKVKSPYRVRD